MSNRLRHFQRAGAHRFERVLELENPYEAAQRNYPATVLIIAGSSSDEYSDLIYPEQFNRPDPQQSPWARKAETFLLFITTLARLGNYL
jgi:hypothetical protein